MLAIPVPEHLDLSLAVPDAPVEDPNSHVAPQEPPGAPEPLLDCEVLEELGRVLAAKGRVQVADVFSQLRFSRVVDLVVEGDGPFGRVHELGPDVLAKGYRDVRVEPPTLVCRGECRGVGNRPPLRESEEVEAGDGEARLLLPVVKQLEHEGSHLLRRRRRKGHPDVPKGARTPEVGQEHTLAGIDHPRRSTLTPPVRLAARTPIARRILERDRPAIESKIDS
jgi:hypothetical protein